MYYIPRYGNSILDPINKTHVRHRCDDPPKQASEIVIQVNETYVLNVLNVVYRKYLNSERGRLFHILDDSVILALKVERHCQCFLERERAPLCSIVQRNGEDAADA